MKGRRTTIKTSTRQINPTRVSIRDIAQAVGVSHVTVANVLNGRHKETSLDTREKVLRAAREMNYIPVAQPSAQQRHIETRIIGIVFDGLEWQSPWGIWTFEGMREAAQDQGYDLLTILRKTPAWALDQEELCFLDRRTDGIIFIFPNDRDEVFSSLVSHKIPVISCYKEDVPAGVAAVTVDNVGAMKAAVHHLYDLGHRRISFVGHRSRRSDFQLRLQGYLQGMRAVGLKPHFSLIDPESDWQDEYVSILQKQQATAVVCVRDALALALLPALEEAGVQVPRDISVIGMDDDPRAEEQGLTTIHISGVDVGRLAVDSMVRLISGETPGHSTVSFNWMMRDSVAPPKADDQ